MKIIRSIWHLILLSLAVLYVLTSCSMTITADGAKSFSVDGAEAARAILIYSSK